MAEDYIRRTDAYRAFCADDNLNGYEKAYCSEIVRGLPAADLVEGIQQTDELKEAMEELNFYRNCHYSASSATEEYRIANALNIVLPLFTKCIRERREE